jgi:hypothetical protein
MTNREALLALARDAGATIYDGAAIGRRADLLRFADALIERCAVICDGVNNYDNPMTAHDVADAIRAMKVSPCSQ